MPLKNLPRLSLSAIIAAISSLTLVALFLATRAGQITNVVVMAEGDQFTAFIDGHRAQTGALTGPASGGIVLTLMPDANVPSLPRPRGVDSVRVVDLASSKLLFEDDFSVPPARSGKWSV